MQSRFATTSWTTVLPARTTASTESRNALESLCRTYWYPLYALVRHLGHDADGARDLTQSYFAEFLEKGYLEDYDPARGRFRVFLKASLKNFLSKQRDKERTWKRGGRTEVLSLDTPDVESRYQHEPVDRMNPEEISNDGGRSRSSSARSDSSARSRRMPGGDRSSRASRGSSQASRRWRPTARWRQSWAHRKAS